MPARSAPRIEYSTQPAAVVRTLFANALLPQPNEPNARLGEVDLQPHQLLGVPRLLEIISRHRGALLADEVGLGKTYTALAVARRFKDIEVVAPAALRAMWHEAASRANVLVRFVSSESLSRARADESAADLVVIDEAHWFRNAATTRYNNAARRYRRSAVLLLSATPLHNRPADLAALFALFLGPRARRLTPHDIGALTVRRGRAEAVAVDATPRVMPTVWRRVRCDARLLGAVLTLEPPIPVKGGDVAMTLLRLTLLHRLSSSDAALRATLKTLLARGHALLAAAHRGRYPTASELRSWLIADDAIQLAFPELVVAPKEPDDAPSRLAIQQHVDSIRSAIGALDAAPNQDARRAAVLAGLLRRFPLARVVAFSQYEATVTALGRLLRRHAGVATLSAKGAQIASGRIPRGEVLRQFDATQSQQHVPRGMRIQLLLTTDLLSEGVNLHNASVAVHLDLPWTAARLEQRIGRLSRIGSPHQHVHVFGFAPPAALDRLQRKVARLRAKWRASARRFGGSALLGQDHVLTSRHSPAGSSHAEAAHALRRLVANWLGGPLLAQAAHRSVPVVAHVALAAADRVALALLRGSEGVHVVAMTGGRTVSTDPREVLRVAERLASAPDAPAQRRVVAATIRCLQRYLAHRRGERAARGNIVSPATARLRSRIALTVASLPRSNRPEGLRIAATLFELFATVRSAGDHAVLGEKAARLLELAAFDPLQWLTTAERDLLGCFTHGARARAPEAWRVDAILVGS